MMKLLIAIVPGVAFACVSFLFFIAAIQGTVYLKTHYQRSKYIALFSFFAGLFALEHVVVQSRFFTPTFTHYYVMFSSASLMLSFVFYMKSLSFFIAVPDRLYRVYVGGLVVLFLFVLGGIGAYLVLDQYPFFDPRSTFQSDNYFINSYTMRIGKPVPYVSILLSLSGIINIVGSTIILRKVVLSTRDVFFMIGLSLSVLTNIFENILLPFTFSYFVPVIFISNLFEAFRMNSLALSEFMSEKNLSHHIALTEAAKKAEALREKEERYQNSQLSEERLKRLGQRVRQVLAQEQCFTNPNLSSDELARLVGVPSYQLSQVINLGLNTNFYELVNQYRIDFVKKCLEDPQNADSKIIDLAYDAGFNSKSAFNSAFKKITGVTPSEFRKGHRQTQI